MLRLRRESSILFSEEEADLRCVIAGDHHGDIGDTAVGDRPFRTAQAAADDAGMDGGGFRVAVALRQRQTANQGAVRQLREVLPALSVRSRGQDGLGGQIGG